MVSVRISSYGCTREVWRARKKCTCCWRRGASIPRYMNQFFYNVATTYWALKHVLLVINYIVLTMHGEGKQRSLVS